MKFHVKPYLSSNIAKIILAFLVLISFFLISLILQYQYGRKLAYSSARLKDSVIPRTMLSMSILDEIDDMTANALEYTLGEIEEKDEFYNNYHSMIIYLNTLKIVVPEKKLFIEQVTDLVEEYEKKARTQIFEMLDLDLKAWAEHELDELLSLNYIKLKEMLHDLRPDGYDVNNVNYNKLSKTEVYKLILSQNMGLVLSELNSYLRDYVKGNASVKKDFINKVDDFETLINQLNNADFSNNKKDFFVTFKSEYKRYYTRSLEILIKYDPSVGLKVNAAVDSLEHDIVSNLEQLLVMEANSAEKDVKNELSSLNKVAHVNKDLLWGLFFGVILLSVAVFHFMVRNIFRPLRDLSKDLNMLAKNKTDIDIEHQQLKNEMGAMARSVQVLKDNVIARMKAESSLIDAKKKAEEATEYKSNFLANMSHEIRTPMNAINGMVDLSLKKTQNKYVRDYLLKIKQSSATLLHIINDILDFSKIEAGKLKIEKIDFDLDKVLENLSTYLSQKNRTKGLEILYKVDPKVPLGLIGDPLRLEQVLLNLASNSMKFTDHGEIVIAVSVMRISDGVVKLRFSVSDTGIGIPNNIIEKLLKPFTQADSTTTRIYGGTGLGLTISKNLVELMGGDLSIKSNPGQGTDISFVLAMEYFDQDIAVLDTNNKLHDSEFILLDSNKTSQDVLKNMLLGLGFKTIKQIKRDQVIESIFELDNQERITVVFIDWNWGVKPSSELVDYINDKMHDENIKTIFTTSDASSEVLDMIESHKPDAVLVKPFSSSTLYNTLVTIIGHKAILMHQRPSELDNNFIINKKKLNGLSLLVAEDNEINQDVIYDLLSDEGINVTIKENGLKVLQELKYNPDKYAAILMDIQMPLMDGYSTAKEIRKSDAVYKDIPIIALTAHALDSHREQTKEAGMNGHVVKPIDIKFLFDQLVKYIDFNKAYVDSPREIVEDEYDYSDWNHLVLPGLHVDKGIKRYNNKKRAYLIGIKSFYRTVPQKWDELKNDLANKRFEDAFEAAHSLKGGCSLVDADDLGKKIETLEQSLRESSSFDEDLIHEIDELLEIVLKSVKNFLEHCDLDKSGG